MVSLSLLVLAVLPIVPSHFPHPDLSYWVDCDTCFPTFCVLQTGSYCGGVIFEYKLLARSPSDDIVTLVLLPILYCGSLLCLFKMVSHRLGWPQTSYVDLNLILLPLPPKCWYCRDKLSHLVASMLFVSIAIKVWHVHGGSFLSVSSCKQEIPDIPSVYVIEPYRDGGKVGTILHKWETKTVGSQQLM